MKFLRRKLDSKGFGHIELLVIVVIVLVVACTGYFVWNHNKDNTTVHAGSWKQIGGAADTLVYACSTEQSSSFGPLEHVGILLLSGNENTKTQYDFAVWRPYNNGGIKAIKSGGINLVGGWTSWKSSGWQRANGGATVTQYYYASVLDGDYVEIGISGPGGRGAYGDYFLGPSTYNSISKSVFGYYTDWENLPFC